tara:strand:+ start:313 stop:1008 length:696 start_codon:yes stop_codon:yes gene_type:complete
MKNILARGGIEFLAVFLGIGLSFYVEQWQSDNEQKDLLVKDCQNILTDVDEDILTIENIIDFNNVILKACNNIQSTIISDEVIIVDSIILDIKKLTYPTFFGITRSYKLSYSTGRLNLYANEKLVKEISKLYDHFYERLDINSNIYDQVGLKFLDQYVDKNIGYAINGYDYDIKEIVEFLSNKLFINELLTFSGRVGAYLQRLNETKEQLIVVRKLLIEYLAEQNKSEVPN